DGKINLVENYDPNLGGPIVYYYWSNHYLHSTFNNLVISGLCGIRPSEGDSLTINPLIDNSIEYFYLDNINYRGHDVSVVYDRDGAKYNIGKGVTVFVDGKKADATISTGKTVVHIGERQKLKTQETPVNMALNLRKKDFPVPSASVNNIPDSLYQAIDGRIWYFPEIRNRWATTGSTSTTDWYSIDFGKTTTLKGITVYLFADHSRFEVPDSFTVEYKSGNEWKIAELISSKPLTGNTSKTIEFSPVQADALRVTFEHKTKQVALAELECF
ncbi:MAG TPA: discoidin domain-containing protein, partial [Cyclobacteriaceae bacterium]|nr:discoidin domain-containing protein [Cyclobacteriaceae bacterium]